MRNSIVLSLKKNRMMFSQMSFKHIPLYSKCYDDAEKTKVIADGMSAMERNVKRAGDFLLATVSLLLISPLMLLIYIMVRCEDGGPAIFKQERIGRFGRPFYIYKFRSMTVDAEKDGPQLCSHKKDKRLTRIGKFLRKHHLDELPQLWNVLCGDMSFIGPRPERKFYIDQIMERDPRYKNLYQIRPTQPSITDTQIRWRRCCAVWIWTFTTLSIVHGGLIPES